MPEFIILFLTHYGTTRDGGKHISVQIMEDLKQATGQGFCLQLKSDQTWWNMRYGNTGQKLHLRDGTSIKEHESAKKKNHESTEQQVWHWWKAQ